MSIIAPGTPVPDFVLKRTDGTDFTQDDLAGTTTVFVFYPFAFSSVCTDQLQIYDEVDGRHHRPGRRRSTPSRPMPARSQGAFKEQLGVSIDQLSDFEPKGETARKFGAYFEPAGHDEPRARRDRPGQAS